MIICTRDIFPCPPEYQQRAQSTAEAIASLGLTTETVLQSVGWGFSFVMLCAFFGFTVGSVVKMLGKL